MEPTTIRLDKYLANQGVCARRNVETVLAREIVTVNGKRVTEPGIRINPEIDRVLINDNKITTPQFRYFLLHKPKGIITTAADEYGRKTVISLIPSKERIYPVGRLDKDTTGLLLLTNDGELTHLLTHPRYHVEKTYRLTIKGKIQEDQLASFQKGIRLSDGVTSPARVRMVNEGMTHSILEVTIHEGKNRQIRRMCEAVGIHLLELSRITFGPLTLGNLPEGKWRALSALEVQLLKQLHKA